MLVAAPRFVGFTPVGTVTVGPSSGLVVVGSFSLAEGADTLWVNVKQNSPSSANNFSYGILSWRSSDGRTLGSAKVYGRTEGEVYALSCGLSPLERGGSIVFEPRAYNLKWIRDGGPSWSLSFSAASGQQFPPPDAAELGAVLGSPVDLDGQSLLFREADDGTLVLIPN